MSMDVVTGAVGSLISKLGELLTDECNLQKGVQWKIGSLIKELECAQAALRELAGVPPNQLREQDRIWAREVREASYDMEDVLITFIDSAEGGHEHFDHNSLFERLKKKMVDVYNMVVSDSFKRRKIAVTIDDINERLNKVIERRGRYAVDSIVANGAATLSVDPRLEAMYKEVTQPVGIDHPSSKLISMLSLPEDGEFTMKTMKIVSIVGPGGLGKTTLAKAVYDKLNKVKFLCAAFVPVGRDRESKEVFLDILMDLHKKYTDLKYRAFNQMQLINELREFLGSKRYLIVLDDVWETKSWDEIKLALAENSSGSRIITTTRKSDVAEQADEIYKLQPLPCKKSRKLFYTRIFGGEGKCSDNQLDEVCEKILKRCDGVPLAIITMASLLVGKSREQWIEVCNSIAFHDKDNKHVTDTEWILSLSYYDLPAHLKTCLLYLSAFPEDKIIDKDSLIWKWVAEDFVHKKPGTGYFEVGEGYFNELVNRSMIQPVESKYMCGFIVGCRVHDMMLDLLRVKSQEENFVTISDNDDEGKILSPRRRVHRLSHQNITVDQIHPDDQMDLQHTRTYVAFRCAIVNEGLSFLSFELLRVLALEGFYLENLLHLENLVHLRYLGLRETVIDEVPTGIGAMKFLQTLDFWNSFEEKQVLPSSIGQLTRLMCLRAGNAEVPNGVIEKLTSLEELRIHAWVDTAAQFVRDLGKLRELRVLNAMLTLKDKSMQSDLVESLGNLHNIRQLKLWGGSRDPDKTIWDAMVLPRLLHCLIVDIVTFASLPSWINPSDLPNLCHLELRVSKIDEQGLKILGRLPELRHLDLRLSSGVTIIIHPADCCFQKLRTLALSRSAVWFVLNEDLSVSFTLWNRWNAPAFGSETRDEGRVAPPTILPNLEVLQFEIYLQDIMRDGGSCDNLGLECLPSLQKVGVTLWCDGALAAEVEKEKAALTHAIQIHPNRPTLEIVHVNMGLFGQLLQKRRMGCSYSI